MKYELDLSDLTTIRESGMNAFKCGVSLDDHEIGGGSHAISLWKEGWKEQESKTCKGRNCEAIDGFYHSAECRKDHEDIYIR